MGTVFCRNGVSTNGQKNSKMVTQVLRMKEPDARPRPQLNIKRVREMVLLDDYEVAKRLQISHGSAYEIIHNRLSYQSLCKMGPKTTHNAA